MWTHEPLCPHTSPRVRAHATSSRESWRRNMSCTLIAGCTRPWGHDGLCECPLIEGPRRRTQPKPLLLEMSGDDSHPRQRSKRGTGTGAPAKAVRGDSLAGKGAPRRRVVLTLRGAPPWRSASPREDSKAAAHGRPGKSRPTPARTATDATRHAGTSGDEEENTCRDEQDSVTVHDRVVHASGVATDDEDGSMAEQHEEEHGEEVQDTEEEGDAEGVDEQGDIHWRSHLGQLPWRPPVGPCWRAVPSFHACHYHTLVRVATLKCRLRIDILCTARSQAAGTLLLRHLITFHPVPFAVLV